MDVTNRSTRYVAFVRAINVAGHAIIKMTDLRDAFAAAGCKNATTFIQTGNVIFDTSTGDSAAVFRKIKTSVCGLAGGDAEIVYRTIDDLEALVRSSPFKGLESDLSLKLYVTFLATMPPKKPKFPLVDPKEGLDAIGMKGLDVLLVSRRKPSGFYGFPNNFI